MSARGLLMFVNVCESVYERVYEPRRFMNVSATDGLNCERVHEPHNLCERIPLVHERFASSEEVCDSFVSDYKLPAHNRL